MLLPQSLSLHLSWSFFHVFVSFFVNACEDVVWWYYISMDREQKWVFLSLSLYDFAPVFVFAFPLSFSMSLSE